MEGVQSKISGNSINRDWDRWRCNMSEARLEKVNPLNPIWEFAELLNRVPQGTWTWDMEIIETWIPQR